MMNDWSFSDNFISEFMKAKNIIDQHSSQIVVNNMVISSGMFRVIQDYFPDEQKLMKIEIEYYDE
jgi:hypothetical protein